MHITGAWGAWRNTRIKKKLLLLVTGVHAPSFFFAKKKTAAAGSDTSGPGGRWSTHCGGHRVTAGTPPRRLGPLPAAATLSALGLQDGCG